MTQQLARQLEHEFSPVLRAEGAQLVRDGRVSISEHAHGFLLAEVEDGEVYDVGLRWSDDQVRTDAACTCGRFREGGSCPHLWAVIVAQAAAEEDEPEEAGKEEAVEPADWRFRLRLLRPPRTRKLRDPWKGVPPGSSRIVFVVGVDKTLNEARVVLRLYHEKRLRNGRYGTRKALDLPAWREAPARDPLDVKVLGLLGESLVEMPAGGSSRNARTPAAHLDEAQAELLLPLLCQSARLFLEVGERRSSGALAWDADQPWDLRFELARDEELDQCLLDAVLVRGEQRIPLSEPWLFLGLSWFFLEGALCRFRAHGAGPWLESIRREGPLRARLDEESELLRALLEQSGTPAVVAAGVRWADVQPPRPHLWIGRRSGGSASLEARVSFDYAGVRVRASDELQVLKQPAADGALATLIRRDLAAESERLAQLLGAPGVEACEPEAQRDALVASERLVDLVRTLLDAGWAVDAEGLRWRRSGTLRYSVHTGLDWFDLQGGLDFEGETASFPALLEAAREKRRTVKLGDGSIGILPERWLEDWRLFEALGEEQDDALRFEKSQGWVLDALLAGRENVELDAGFESLRARIAAFSGVRALEQPPDFRGELRTYQREALGWLAFLGELGFGGCLADDMGLGKTVQILAHLLRRKAEHGETRPSLVVAPRSLCFHWVQEAARFSPGLSVVEYTGGDRQSKWKRLAQHDLVVTTYGTLRQDAERLSKIRFDTVVLDEAQAIKNPASQSAKAARLLRAERRLALSGTPVENHLGDLWSIFEFLNPGMLGRLGALRDVDTRSALPAGDKQSFERLARALRPFFLRRTKEQVLSDLPEKTEQTLLCSLEGRQREEYDELREHFRSMLAGMQPGHGAGIHVLTALLRLRQAACHPGLLDPARVGDSSAKLEALLGMLEDAREGGHKALVFSQFTSLLAIVRSNLDARGLAYEYLDGGTEDREACVRRFQEDPDCPFFLISLKAGGFGLNLTAADYVFLLDPWWNPAVESQAIDRAHRIGQTRRVMAYRIVARGTIEERVLELQEQKRGLAEAILREDAGGMGTLTREDLELLLS
jgi:superfamily II DNA or RNA helicase